MGLPVNWIAADILRIENGILGRALGCDSGRGDPGAIEEQVADVRFILSRLESHASQTGRHPAFTLHARDLKLKNRIVMAPLTRTRAQNLGKIPNELMVEYYTQRAGAGLIITEGTFVSEQGQGWFGAPEFTPRNNSPAGRELQTPFTVPAGLILFSYGTRVPFLIAPSMKMVGYPLGLQP